MKRKLALLLSLALLTACADNTVSSDITEGQTETEAVETVEVTTITSTTASITVATTTAATTTAAPIEETEEPSVPQSDNISPVHFSEADVMRSMSEDHFYAAIEEQIGYDTPVDITQLYDYEYAKKFAESFPDELYREAVACNYSYIYFDELYIGSDYADWLCSASYILNTDMPGSVCYYTRLFYVKDGKVTDHILEGVYGLCELRYDYTGENIIIATGDGLYSLPRMGGELVKLSDTKYFCRVHYVSDKYMLYSDRDNVIEVYYFDTGENFMTDIYFGYQDCTPHGLTGDTITYYSYETHSYHSFDIITQEYNTDISESDFKQLSEFFCNAAKNSAYTASASGAEIQICCNNTEQTKSYNLDGLNTYHIELLGFFCDRLYIQAGYYSDVYLLALDVESGKAQTFYLNGEQSNYIDFTLDPLTGKVFAYSDQDDAFDIIEFQSEELQQHITDLNAYLDEHYEKAEYYEIDGAVVARTSSEYYAKSRSLQELYNTANERMSLAKHQFIKVGDRIAEDLVVEAASCRYVRDEDVVFSEMMRLGGELTLTGIIHRCSETDALDFSQKGDLVFCPFPDSISDLPISFNNTPGNNLTVFAQDEENSLYEGGDTISIYIGNSEINDFPYRGGFNENNDVSAINMEYNTSLDALIGEDEYYIATLAFDKLFVQQKDAPKTGCYYNFGNISKVISVETYEFTTH